METEVNIEKESRVDYHHRTRYNENYNFNYIGDCTPMGRT
jgi:hypothetical protein